MRLLDTWVGVDQGWCERRLAEGWGGLIQGAGSGGHAAPLYPTMQAECRNSLRAMRLAGGLTASYFNANPWYSPQVTHDDAMRAVGDELEHLSFLVLDYELSPEPATSVGARDLVERTRELVALVRATAPDVPLIGYSGAWFVGFMATLTSDQEFDLDGYWNARYDGVPDLSVNPPVTWRMHTRLVGKQYKGTTVIEGKVTDLNVFDDAWIAEITQPEEDDVATTIVIQMDGQPEVFTWPSRIHIKNPEEYNALKEIAEQDGGKWKHRHYAPGHNIWRSSFVLPHGLPHQYRGGTI